MVQSNAKPSSASRHSAPGGKSKTPAKVKMYHSKSAQKRLRRAETEEESEDDEDDEAYEEKPQVKRARRGKNESYSHSGKSSVLAKEKSPDKSADEVEDDEDHEEGQEKDNQADSDPTPSSPRTEATQDAVRRIAEEHRDTAKEVIKKKAECEALKKYMKELETMYKKAEMEVKDIEGGLEGHQAKTKSVEEALKAMEEAIKTEEAALVAFVDNWAITQTDIPNDLGAPFGAFIEAQQATEAKLRSAAKKFEGRESSLYKQKVEFEREQRDAIRAVSQKIKIAMDSRNLVQATRKFLKSVGA